MGVKRHTTKPFDTKRSIRNALDKKATTQSFALKADNIEYKWSSKIERVEVIRKGIPYGAIEVISEKLNKPLKSVLDLVGLPQDNYPKKKAERLLLDRRVGESVLVINELLDYGLEVFNHEAEKFQRWLQKPNSSLGGEAPESMLDTMTGISEIRFCLNRLEFGNLA